MCYDAVSATRQLLKYAIHRGDAHQAEELSRRLHDLMTAGLRSYYYVSGFSHPGLLVFANDAPFEPQVMTWGLIPSWAKDRKTAGTIMKQTLNARSETIFEKPAFRESARNRRCIVYLDAFYEHYHQDKKTYPYHISMRDGSPLAVAGLWSEWADRDTGEILKTVAIITTRANELMHRIHNNAGIEGPRMPVILPRERQDEWLSPYKGGEDKDRFLAMLQPFDASLMTAHTAPRLKGKEAVGNVPSAEEPVEYPGITFAG